MAKTANTTISFSVTGDGITSDRYSNTNQNTAAPGGGPFPFAAGSGDNPFTPPSGAQYFTLIPPSTSTVVKRLYSSAGSKVHPAKPLCLPVTDALDTIVINFASAEGILIAWT